MRGLSATWDIERETAFCSMRDGFEDVIAVEANKTMFDD